MEQLRLDGDAFHAEWSSDGDEIIISLADSKYEHANYRISNLYLVQVNDLEHAELIFESDGGIITNIKWSPDGEKVAFIQTFLSSSIKHYLSVIWLNVEKSKIQLSANVYNPIWYGDSQNLLITEEVPNSGECYLKSIDLNQIVTSHSHMTNFLCPTYFDWYQNP